MGLAVVRPGCRFCLSLLTLCALSWEVYQTDIFLLLVGVAGLLGFIFMWPQSIRRGHSPSPAWQRRQKANAAQYRAVPLLSPGEAVFFQCLVQLYGASAMVLPKVRLLDLIQPREDLDRSTFQSAFNRISQKHVDFVVLRLGDLAVLGAIELDDRSHERKAQLERDDFVDEVLRQAAIPVCRVKAQREYDLEVLCGQLNSAFTPAALHQVGA
jgi:hypothetical protein